MATGHVRDGCIFPVGFIVQLTVDTDPAEHFGGKWQRIKGRFLLAADEETYPAGSTGGEAKHTLTVEEMPAHSHVTSMAFDGGRGSSSPASGTLQWLLKLGNNFYGDRTQNTGDGQPHNNMPPYRSVYIWERIG